MQTSQIQPKNIKNNKRSRGKVTYFMEDKTGRRHTKAFRYAKCIIKKVCNKEDEE